MTSPTLYYAHDPMCSFCYAFASTWEKLQQNLPKEIDVRYMVGGLALDSDSPMEESLKEYLQNTWRSIEARFNVSFNYDFWTQNTPRRSTYNACRAALIARKHGKEQAMISAIQQAYYQDAKNPSDIPVLADCAKAIGLDNHAFTTMISSQALNDELMDELTMARHLKLNVFPSLLLVVGEHHHFITLVYLNSTPMLNEINRVTSQHSM